VWLSVTVAEKSWSSLLLVPASGEALPILVLSPEYTFLVALAVVDIYSTTDVVFDFKGLSLKNGGCWNGLVTIFGFSKIKSVKISHLFYREEFDAD
jgi:hypothetical protein